MSTVMTAYSTALNLKMTSGTVSSPSKAGTAATAKDGAGTAMSAGSGSPVIVTLSVQAQKTMLSAQTGSAQATSQVQGTAAKPSGAGAAFLRYFPTRDGMPATALADAVANPGQESSSAGKTLDQVGTDARERMDAAYKAMEASRQPFDYNSAEGRDWNSLMGSLDRRSLYAVSSNTGGQFTKQEQDIAKTLMSQQQSLASGLYHGPTSQMGSYTDPYNGDVSAKFKAAASFLDKVSGDEKSSVAWASSRAAAQISYQWRMSGSNEPAEDLSSDNPLVKLIVSAMDTVRTGGAGRGMSGNAIHSADDLKKEKWFKGFESQLDGAMRQAKEMYRATSAATTASAATAKAAD